MTFKSAAGGINAKGKTKGKNLGESGKSVAIEKNRWLVNKKVQLLMAD